MGLHSVACHPAKVTFPPLLQRIKPTTRFNDAGGMEGRVDLVDCLQIEMAYPPEDGHPSQY